jgi:ribosomal protein S18 acetylase RimI-like enzyme
MESIRFRSFVRNDIPDMRKVFNQAFEDYLIPVLLNESDFKRKLIEKSRLNFKYSVGCFDNKQLVGFLFHTIEEYQKKKTAYNGGTGVIPDYRGNNLTYRMYEHIIPKLIKKKVEDCILEVISNNKPALQSYEKVGFRKSKFYHCLKLDEEGDYLKNPPPGNFRTVKSPKPQWEIYSTFRDYESSFLDTFHMLKKNLKSETILESYDGDDLVGYIIYNKRMGRVGNIGVHKKYRGRGIGTSLIRKMHADCRKKPIYILNVNERSYNLLNFFLRLGFKNDIDQFELKLKLSKL